MGPWPDQLLLHPAAVTLAQFHRITSVCPIGDASRIDKQLFVRNLRVTQCQCCKLAVFAITAVAIDDDFLRGLAKGIDRSHVILRMIIIELIGAGNVAALIMLIVPCIDKNDSTLLIKGIVEQLRCLVTIDNLKPFFFEPRDYRIRRQIRASNGDIGAVCSGSWNGKSFAVEIVLAQFKSARGERVGGESSNGPDCRDQKRFE